MATFDRSDSMKICFMAGTLEHGGAERQLFYMLQALCQGGAAPRVFCFDRGEHWEERIRALGVPVTWVGQSQSRLARLVRVLRELRSDPPDVFQSQHFFANAYVGLSAFLLGVHGIGAMRSEAVAEMKSNGVTGGWLNLNLPPIIAANSRLAIDQAIARGVPRSRLYFLPNVVDTQRFKPDGRSAERPLTLLAVGRLTKQKRFDRFVSALGRLRAELNVEVRGWIVGPTQDQAIRKELEAQAARLGLFPEGLQFLGGVSDMAPLYQQADLCVLTSDFEGTPNVLLEAMASGLPVVATKVGGVPEIVQHGATGFVVGREDMEGLVAALVQLVSNAPQRTEMGCRAREYVEEKHSLKRLPAYLSDLYSMVLPARRPWKLGVVEGTPV
jgi:glycosyltransferase involved in cell wall biosynthesis